MAFKASIKGIEDWHKRLKDISSKTTQKQCLRAAVRAMAKPANRELKRGVPSETAAYKKSIVTVVRSKGYNIKAVVGPSLDYEQGGKIPKLYDHLVESGFETRDGRSIAGQHNVEKIGDKVKDESEALGTAKLIETIEKKLKG